MSSVSGHYRAEEDTGPTFEQRDENGLGVSAGADETDADGSIGDGFGGGNLDGKLAGADFGGGILENDAGAIGNGTLQEIIGRMCLFERKPVGGQRGGIHLAFGEQFEKGAH